MLEIVPGCIALVIATSIIHYEALRLLSAGLPRLPIAPRLKVMVVVFVAFLAHTLQILLYALVYYMLLDSFGKTVLQGVDLHPLFSCVYFSAETFTSLGYGDILPVGAPRLLVGAEALNGLLLIGWSASYLYVTMERFWYPRGPSSGR